MTDVGQLGGRTPPAKGPNPRTYSLRYCCSNCDYEGSRDISRGTPHSRCRCPICNCLTYRKKGSI